MKKLFLSLMALMLAATVLAGCTQSKPAESPKEEPKAEEPAPIATEYAAQSTDGKLKVIVKVTNQVASVEMVAQDFTWNKTYAAKEPKEPKNNGNEGHAILTLDSNEPLYVGSMRTGLTKLTPGDHTLKVQLVNNDNTPKNIETTVKFTVK